MKILKLCTNYVTNRPWFITAMNTKPAQKVIKPIGRYYAQAYKDAAPIISAGMRGGYEGCLGTDNMALAPYTILRAAYRATENAIKTKNFPGAFSAAAIIAPIPGSGAFQVPLHRLGFIVKDFWDVAAQRLRRAS